MTQDASSRSSASDANARGTEPDVTRRDLGALLGLLGGAAGLAALGACSNQEGGQREPVSSSSQALSGANILWVDSIVGTGTTTLRSLYGSDDAGTSVAVAIVGGYAAPNDGGGGVFYWSNTSGADDGGTVIVPGGDAGNTGACWKRIYSGPLNVKWFGASGNGTTDDAAAIGAAISAASTGGASSGVVFFPKGRYLIQSVTGFVIGTAITLLGEGNPPGGTEGQPTNFPVLLKGYSDPSDTLPLLTFDGSGSGGTTAGSGGGVEKLRIVQYGGSSGGTNGTAIYITGSSSSSRASWVKLRQLVIEENGSADGTVHGAWNWAIKVDGTGCGGIIDLYIGEVSTHTGVNGPSSGALLLSGVTEPLIYNCAFYINGVVSVTGVYTQKSSNVQLVNLQALSIQMDYAETTTAIGAILTSVSDTTNTTGQNLIIASQPLTDSTVSNLTGIFTFNGASLGTIQGTFQPSKPIAIHNGHALYGLNATAGGNAVSLIGIDGNNAIRLGENGDQPLAVGSLASLSLTNATGGDITLPHGKALRFASTGGTNRAVYSDTSDNLFIGTDMKATTIYGGGGNGLSINTTGTGFNGATPIAKPTVTGSKGGNVALGNLVTALASLGLIVDGTS